MKNKNAQTLLVVGLAALCTTPLSYAHSIKKPYLGVNTEKRNFDLVPGFGKEMFTKRIPQSNLYMGFTLNELFNVEFGQQFTQTATRTLAINEENVFMGVPQNNGEYYITENKIKMNASYINIVGKAALNTRCSLLGAVGLASFKVKARVKFIGDENLVVFDPDQRFSAHFNSRRIIPQAGIGMSLGLSDKTFLRLMATYQFTSKFKNIVAQGLGNELANSQLRMSLKNNQVYSVGLTHQF